MRELILRIVNEILKSGFYTAEFRECCKIGQLNTYLVVLKWKAFVLMLNSPLHETFKWLRRSKFLHIFWVIRFRSTGESNPPAIHILM